MIRIEGEIVIRKPIEDVFDFVADERNEPRYNPNMIRADKVSPGPIGVGTEFRAEMAAFGHPVATTTLTAVDRPSRLSSQTTLPSMYVRGTLTFEPAGDGTRMRWSWELEPRGLLRLAGPLLGPVARRQEAANWAHLKRFLETGPERDDR